MKITDIHCHLLPGVDDGAKDMEDTKAMLKIAADDGIQRIMFTPHIRRPWLKRPWSKVLEAFEKVKEYAASAHPQLELYLGSEFDYSGTILREEPHQLHDLSGSGMILVEFKPYDKFDRIREGIQQVQMAGYDVMLAHIERYDVMLTDIDLASRIADLGALIQVNADDIVHPGSFKMRGYMKKMIDRHLIDLAGSDAHDVKFRRPELSKAYEIVKKRAGADYADYVFGGCADRIIKRDV